MRHTPTPWNTGGIGNPTTRPRTSIWGPTPSGKQSGEWIAKDVPLNDAAFIIRAVNSHAALLEALKASNDALKAWLHIYADTECEETEVQRYKALVRESGGTLSYLAKHFAMNKTAIAQAEGGA